MRKKKKTVEYEKEKKNPQSSVEATKGKHPNEREKLQKTLIRQRETPKRKHPNEKEGKTIESSHPKKRNPKAFVEATE